MDLSNLGSFQEPPELARLEVHDFRWRIGKLFQTDGTFVGLKLELYSTAMPWFKVHFPFSRLDVAAFIGSLNEEMQEGIDFERSEPRMGDDNPETETAS